jgi:hypothetical protein
MAYWLRGHTQDLLHVRSQAHHPLRGRNLGADLVHVEGTVWLRVLRCAVPRGHFSSNCLILPI